MPETEQLGLGISGRWECPDCGGDEYQHPRWEVRDADGEPKVVCYACVRLYIPKARQVP